MRRLAIGAIGAAIVLMATGTALYEGAIPNRAHSDEIVADMPRAKHDKLALVDTTACRQEALAGQDKALEASSSRIERQELASRPELVVKYCECKFAGAQAIMTEREMVTQWLSANSAFSETLPSDACAKLDALAVSCAQEYGLRT